MIAVRSSVSALLPLFELERAAQRAAVLAVVVRTEASTYSKPGGLMLIAGDGRYAGLLSGGCLEGDLRTHASRVLGSGAPAIVSYDMRGPDDLLFGLGAGCEGAMDIFLLPVGPQTHWRPLALFVEHAARGRRAAAAFVVESADAGCPAGSVVQSDDASPEDHASSAQLRRHLLEAVRDAERAQRPGWCELSGTKAFIAVLSLPTRLLVLGGGPDAAPVVQLASFLGWKATVLDHREAYAQVQRFPLAAAVRHVHPREAADALALDEFDAAIVMSHHLATDRAWLEMLAATHIPYVGLLGPAARRQRLLAELGQSSVAALQDRLRAPVGLDIGGRAPESIALSIISEVHAALEGRPGEPFSRTHHSGESM